MVALNLRHMKAMNQVFKRLNNLRRWTAIATEGKYDEISKQALNSITTYLLASYSEEAEEPVKMERFPKIAIYRAFQKVYVNFDVPEPILSEICQIGNIDKANFARVTRQFIEEKTDPEFTHFICDDIEDTQEMRIYRAATKIATLVELVENHFKFKNGEEYDSKMREIWKYLEKFSDLPGIEELQNTKGNVFRLLEDVSKLRNQNRWAVQSYTTECSVLGHLFDTAVLAYLAGLEKYQNETVATKLFFIGCFHDSPETWSKDIPSDIKDRIPGFRKATEEYELKMLDQNMYSRIPDFLVVKLKQVMFEEKANLPYKKDMKGADYLSAGSECWRQYVSGSRDIYFKEAMEKTVKKLGEGILELTPVGLELHDYFLDCTKGLVLM